MTRAVQIIPLRTRLKLLAYAAIKAADNPLCTGDFRTTLVSLVALLSDIVDEIETLKGKS